MITSPSMCVCYFLCGSIRESALLFLFSWNCFLWISSWISGFKHSGVTLYLISFVPRPTVQFSDSPPFLLIKASSLHWHGIHGRISLFITCMPPTFHLLFLIIWCSVVDSEVFVIKSVYFTSWELSFTRTFSFIVFLKSPSTLVCIGPCMHFSFRIIITLWGSSSNVSIFVRFLMSVFFWIELLVDCVTWIIRSIVLVIIITRVIRSSLSFFIQVCLFLNLFRERWLPKRVLSIVGLFMNTGP